MGLGTDTLVILFLFGIYFAPVLIATSRGMNNAGSVLVVCLFLGWTVFGWIAALVMALHRREAYTIVNVQEILAAPTKTH